MGKFKTQTIEKESRSSKGQIRPSLSVIIPVYQEAENLESSLRHFQGLRQLGAELIIVDGYSSDESHQCLQACTALWDQCLVSGPGRARQMNAGAEFARADHLLFLHLDSRFNSDFSIEELKSLNPDKDWAYCHLHLCRREFSYRLIGHSINWRSKVTGSVTGDQGICLSKFLFEKIGRYPDIPLMEDVALSDALRKVKAPVQLNCHLQTSSRRWQKHGVMKTIVMMWWLRAQYRFGVSSSRLAKKYYPNINYDEAQQQPTVLLEAYIEDTKPHER